MSMALAIPTPAELDLTSLPDLCLAVERWSDSVDDLGALTHAQAAMGAIAEYHKKLNKSASASVTRTLRHLEVRIGTLLGPAKLGSNQHDEGFPAGNPSLTPKERHLFRKIAEHADEPAVAEAIEAGASRSEVLRRIEKRPRAERIEQIRSLAAEGHSTPQIAAEMGVSEGHIRHICHDEGITVQADVALNKSRRIKHDRMIEEVANQLEAVATSLELIDPYSVDEHTREACITSMRASLKSINRFMKGMS